MALYPRKKHCAYLTLVLLNSSMGHGLDYNCGCSCPTLPAGGAIGHPEQLENSYICTAPHGERETHQGRASGVVMGWRYCWKRIKTYFYRVGYFTK